MTAQMGEKLIASGGLCEPIPESFIGRAIVQFRSVHRTFTDTINEQLHRASLPPDELIVYDLTYRGFHDHGRPDIAALVCEERWAEEDDDLFEHVWDSPIRLYYSRSRERSY